MAQYSKSRNRLLDQSADLFETVLLTDREGNVVDGSNPSGVALDAFGRHRVSQPITLFESFNLKHTNDKFTESLTGGGSVTYDSDQSAVLLNVAADQNDQVIRETKRVFPYQPGKSLLIENTFAFDSAQTGLRQRVGYFNDENGIFLEGDSDTVSFVLRSKSSGTVTETRIPQGQWNKDKLNGSGPSGITFDKTKTQIFWIDLQWLGVGTVRCGFVIDGKIIHCHSFNHANIENTTYMTTAVLPIRCEITNTAAISTGATLKQICSAVLTEGGFEARGDDRFIGTAVDSAHTLGTSGTFYPVISVRLKPEYRDKVTIVKSAGLLVGEASTVQYKLVKGGQTQGGTWLSLDSDTNFEYNLNGTSFSGGKDIAGGLATNTFFSGAQSNNLDQDLFQMQLERNGLTDSNFELTLVATASGTNIDVFGTLNLQEVT